MEKAGTVYLDIYKIYLNSGEVPEEWKYLPKRLFTKGRMILVNAQILEGLVYLTFLVKCMADSY